jgi:hypothetical protein
LNMVKKTKECYVVLLNKIETFNRMEVSTWDRRDFRGKFFKSCNTQGELKGECGVELISGESTIERFD